VKPLTVRSIILPQDSACSLVLAMKEKVYPSESVKGTSTGAAAVNHDGKGHSLQVGLAF
jgi:hypothetical protein